MGCSNIAHTPPSTFSSVNLVGSVVLGRTPTRIGNCIFLTECPFPVNIFGNWVDSGIFRFSDRELLITDSYSKWSAFLTYIIFVESLLRKFTVLYFY